MQITDLKKWITETVSALLEQALEQIFADLYISSSIFIANRITICVF